MLIGAFPDSSKLFIVDMTDRFVYLPGTLIGDDNWLFSGGNCGAASSLTNGAGSDDAATGLLAACGATGFAAAGATTVVAGCF
jgi:hypothetical protein